MPYEYKIDEIITKYLYNTKKITREKGLGFNETEKIVKKLHPHITPRVLNRHLDFMKVHHIINREDESSPGLKRCIWLTNNTKLALDLDFPIPEVKSKKEKKFKRNIFIKETKEQRNKKIFPLLMSLLTIGFTAPQHIDNISKKARAGDILETFQHILRFSDPLPGISISNLFHEYRDSANGGRFRYLKFKNDAEVKWYLKKLREFEPPIIKPINEIEWFKRERLEKNLEWPIVEKSNGKEDEETIRYGIADRQLHEFLDRCIVLLDGTERLMKHIWKYKRKPKHDEVEWYSFIYGKAYANSIFIESNQNRNWLKKLIGKTSNQRKKVEDDVKAAHKITEETGDFKSLEYKTACMIEDYLAGNDKVNRIRKVPQKVHQRLFGEENYEDVYKKYGIIVLAIKEIAYPRFINEL